MEDESTAGSPTILKSYDQVTFSELPDLPHQGAQEVDLVCIGCVQVH